MIDNLFSNDNTFKNINITEDTVNLTNYEFDKKVLIKSFNINCSSFFDKLQKGINSYTVIEDDIILSTVKKFEDESHCFDVVKYLNSDDIEPSLKNTIFEAIYEITCDRCSFINYDYSPIFNLCDRCELISNDDNGLSVRVYDKVCQEINSKDETLIKVFTDVDNIGGVGINVEDI